MTPTELESFVGRRLGALPGPKAPAALLSRIMADVQRLAGRPWYRRPWLAWPISIQVASAAVLVAVVWLAATGVDRVASAELPALVGAAQALWRLVLEPHVVYVAVFACAMGAASALYCAAISLVLWERSPER